MTFTVRTLDPRPALRHAFATNAPLALAGTIFALAFAGTLVGITVDHRVITGMPAWVKPAKFMISSAIYTFTLLWMLGFVRGHRRLVRAASWITAVAVFVEDAGIALQAARGTTSHFNFSTPFDAAVYQLMAAMTLGLWSGCFLVGLALLLQKLPDPVVAWSLRIGTLLALVGMSLAYLMTVPKAQQLAGAQSRQGLPIIGAHSIGLADGGPGIPFLGWSTVGGDLRIAHFVGLHGLQFLPLFAFAVMRLLPGLRKGGQLALVIVAGATYLGLDLLLAWQALRAQSIIHPDALTLEAVAAILSASAIAVAVVLQQERTLVARMPIASPHGASITTR